MARGLLAYHLPEDDTHADGDVQRMLGAVLGNFQGQVAGIDHILPDAVDFVAEDEGVLAAGLPAEVRAELLRMDGLLHRHQRVAFGPQGGDGVHRVVVMLPRHGVLGAEGRLADLRGGRDGGNAAQEDPVDAEGVGGPEGGADIVRAADVVQDHDEARGGKFLVLGGGDTAQFDVQQFSVAHVHKVKKKRFIFVFLTKATV